MSIRMSTTNTFLTMLLLAWLSFSILCVQCGMPNCPSRRSVILEPEPQAPAIWEEEVCADLNVELAPVGTFPTRPQVGFMGSGNSLLKHLLEAATGYQIGVIRGRRLTYGSHQFTRGPKPSFESCPKNSGQQETETALEDGRTILQLTHHFGWNLIKNGRATFRQSKKTFKDYGGILLMRNPWDAILSFKRRFAKGSKQDAEMEILEYAKIWVKLIRTWLRKSSPEQLLIVQYENLTNDTKGELVRILKFLKVEVNEQRMFCIEKYPFSLPTLNVLEMTAEDLEPILVTKSVFAKSEKLNKFIERSLKLINQDLKKTPFEISLDYKNSHRADKLV